MQLCEGWPVRDGSAVRRKTSRAVSGRLPGGSARRSVFFALALLAGFAPLASLQAADDENERIRSTVSSILEGKQTGRTFKWENPATGNAGMITVLGSFYDRQDRICREYRRTLFAPGEAGGRTVEGVGCRQEAGRWLLLEPQPRLAAFRQIRPLQARGLPQSDPSPEDPGWAGYNAAALARQRAARVAMAARTGASSSSRAQGRAQMAALDHPVPRARPVSAPIPAAATGTRHGQESGRDARRGGGPVNVSSPAVSRHSGDDGSLSPQDRMTGLLAGMLSDYRRHFGLGPVAGNTILTSAAALHAEDMNAHQALRHDGSDGMPFWERARRVGYEGTLLAQNAAHGDVSLQDIFQGWIRSQAHRDNILDPQVNEIGLARSGPYWTLILGRHS